MKFCDFCAKRSQQVKQINENKVTCAGGGVLKIKDLLNIFQARLTKFILDKDNALICNNCLKRLKQSFEFAQQMKESESKFSRGQEIKIEHDYFETKQEDENVTAHTKVTTYQNETATAKLCFKPILPKTLEDIQASNRTKETTLNIKTRLYKCLQCTEVFKSYKHLNEHERDLCKNKFVKFLKVCKLCHKCYSKESLLNEHVSSSHAQGHFVCCFCVDKVFSAKGYLARHIEKVHQQNSLNFFCGECDDMLNLPSQEEMRSHFNEKHFAVKTDPDEQEQTALNDEDMDLEMHEEFLDEFLLAHTNENSFQFSECWEALDLHLPDMLQESAAHMTDVQGFTQAFSCPKCYEQFKSPQPLLKHLADIHDLPVLVCRTCSKCFSSLKDFKRHKLQQCPKNSALHSITLDCPYCNKRFHNSISLKQHLRIVHCQIKKHICQLCDKQYSTLDHLKKHVLSQHQNERKHVCTVCNKKFTQLGHLKQHLAIHTTGKAIQCLECSLKFWRKIDLEKHRQKNHLPATQCK